MLDQNKDKEISMEEINSLTEGGLEFAAKLFPMYMTEDDEIESESENEDESENLDENQNQSNKDESDDEVDEELLPRTHQKKTEL